MESSAGEICFTRYLSPMLLQDQCPVSSGYLAKLKDVQNVISRYIGIDEPCWNALGGFALPAKENARPCQSDENDPPIPEPVSELSSCYPHHSTGDLLRPLHVQLSVILRIGGVCKPSKLSLLSGSRAPMSNYKEELRLMEE